jgi:hypothetical protein
VELGLQQFVTSVYLIPFLKRKVPGTGAARDVCHQPTTVEINKKTEQHFFCTTRFIFLKNQIDFVPRTYVLRPEYRSVCFWFHCRCYPTHHRLFENESTL